jgi:hypothetical protein
VSQKNIKTFKLKARGDAGADKSELLRAFATMLRDLGMTTVLCEDDHHLIVTSTKEQRRALYLANRRRRGNGSAMVTESGLSNGT